jgi:hypothetical protein
MSYESWPAACLGEEDDDEFPKPKRRDVKEQTVRWRLVTWLLWRALKLAPDGSAACSLEDHLNEWAQDYRKAWAARDRLGPEMP